MTDQRFPKRQHLLRPADFENVFGRRKSAADERLVMYAAANDLPYTRLGLSVSRKVGNAVARNRWKRLLREAFRLSREHLPPGCDLVIIPRAGVVPELKSLERSLVQLSLKLVRRLRSPTP